MIGLALRPKRGQHVVCRDGLTMEQDFIIPTDLNNNGAQPVPGESVGMWVNWADSANATRAFQGYVSYTGTYGATSFDASVIQTGNSNFNHLVAYQGAITVGSGSATADHIAGAYMSAVHNGSGVITNSYGYYWGGLSGTGTVTNAWAFFAAGVEPSFLGGNLYVNKKMSIGLSSPSQTLTINDPGNVIVELQKAGVTVAYIANGSAIFGGANAADLGINVANSGRKIIIGNAGTIGLYCVDGLTTHPATSGISITVASTDDATTTASGSIVTSGGIGVAKSIVCGATAGNSINIANATGSLKINGTQVVGPRITGYGTPTGAANQGSFAAGSITLANLAAGVAQLILDLKTHGSIGT